MNKKEIRISNLLLDKDGNIFEVGGVLEGSLLKKGGFIGMLVEWIKPIPLTEEWLLKFGFESIGKLHPTYKLNPFIVELGVLGKHYNFRKIINKEESVNLKEINHIHQLQNLYFALTGEELEIK